MQRTYYKATDHLFLRYKQRMSETVTGKLTKTKISVANEIELERRANYMLMFSIHGMKGATRHTEVRYYFDWDIVIDNRAKTIVTLYQNENRAVPKASLFGDRKIRRKVYNFWFKPHSKECKNLIF